MTSILTYRDGRFYLEDRVDELDNLITRDLLATLHRYERKGSQKQAKLLRKALNRRRAWIAKLDGGPNDE